MPLRCSSLDFNPRDNSATSGLSKYHFAVKIIIIRCLRPFLSHIYPFLPPPLSLPFKDMMSIRFSDPPTASSLADARKSLGATRTSVEQLDIKIDAAEAALVQVMKESQFVINELQRERAALDECVLQAMAYLSPIRRLPMELLRDVFMWCFQDHPCCGWVLAAVCNPWRRLALKMPRIWSKVCIFLSALLFVISSLGTRLKSLAMV